MYNDYIDNIGWNFNFWNSVSASYESIDTTFSYVKYDPVRYQILYRSNDILVAISINKLYLKCASLIVKDDKRGVLMRSIFELLR